jgi:hypothetical protein
VRALGNDPEHLNHWTRSAFTELVDRQFDVVDRPGVFPWTMVVAASRPTAAQADERD